MACRRFRVSGRVQGVFYRATTQDTARRLGLTGWVRNRPEGDVELVACGDEAALKQLEEWLWCGPSHARVQQVTVTDAGEQTFAGFTVTH
jgi:acylphosphatase